MLANTYLGFSHPDNGMSRQKNKPVRTLDIYRRLFFLVFQTAKDSIDIDGKFADYIEFALNFSKAKRYMSLKERMLHVKVFEVYSAIQMIYIVVCNPLWFFNLLNLLW